MPRLSYEKRLRVVSLYLEKNLHFKQGRFEILSVLAENESIISKPLALRRIVTRWLETGRVDNRSSRSRAVKHTKINNEELSALDRLILRNRGLSAKHFVKFLSFFSFKIIKQKFCLLF